MQLMTNNNKTMSSREIAALTGKQLSHIHRDFKIMMTDLGFQNGVAMPSPNMDQGFRYVLDSQARISQIILNQELTLTLVSGYSAKLRSAIIKRWQELEAKQIETPEQLMARALISAQTVIQAKDELLEQAKPAIELHESICNDHGTLSMQDAGKRLQVKPNKFIEWLVDSKYIQDSRLAYQSKIDAGYMLLSTSDHNGRPRTNTRVTGKGFAHLGKKIAEVRFANPGHVMFYKS